jgi:hypothetical protein
METLYEKASLILNPGVYDTSKVYATKPFDGSGDLTFTRSNDTATRVNSAGLIEKVRTNLITYSEQFDNAAWAKTNATVTANTTANPINGALTADTITLAAGTAQKFLAQTLTHSGSFTQSVYLKAGTHQFVQILISGNTSFANFDLVNGTSSASGGVATITAVANGFYRCTLSYTVASGLNVTFIAVDSLAAIRAEATSSTGNFIAFGFQSETGDIATDYIATTSAAVSVGPVANVPRLDYLGSSCPRLLLEPQRTNLVTYSEQFNNAAWGKTTATVTANTTSAPDGTISADTFDATNNFAFVSQAPTLASGTATTYSVFVKNIDAPYVNLQVRTTATAGLARFDFTGSTLTSTTLTTGTSSSFTDYGNGWYRCVLVCTTSEANQQFRIQVPSTGDSVFIWGAQAEAGAYATSYINTQNSAVTRGADRAELDNATTVLPTAYPFTLYAESEAILGENLDFISFLNKSVADNFYVIGYSGSNVVATLRPSGAATTMTSSATYGTSSLKVALVMTSSNAKLFVNGSLQATQVGVASFNSNINDLLIGQLRTVNDASRRASNKQTLIFKTALSDADAITLTA